MTTLRKNTIPILLFTIACAVFSVSLKHRFTLDDFVHLVKNHDIRTVQGGIESFGQAMFPGNLYRPFATLTYALTYAGFGLNPLPYHLTNVLLHGAICVVIFRLLLIFSTLPLACLTTLLFAAHPIHTEAVVNVTNRTELLSSFFGLLALYYALRKTLQQSSSWVNLSLVTLTYLIALLSKESAAVFILLLPFCGYYLGVARSRTLYFYLLAFCLALAVYLAMRAWALGPHLGLGSGFDYLDNPLAYFSTDLRVLNALILLGRYIWMVAFPHPLSADYTYAHLEFIKSFNGEELLKSGELIGYLGLLLLCVALAVRGFRRRSLYSFFCIWFLLSFAVTANIFFPIGTTFGERLLYLPSIGIIGLIVLSMRRIFGRLSVILIALLAAGATYSSASYSEYWYDNKTLHSRQIIISPRSAKTQSNFAVVKRIEKDFDTALTHFHLALKIHPKFAEAAYGIAGAYVDQKIYSGALHWLRRSLEMNRAYVPALILRAKIFLGQGRIDQAHTDFKKALSLDPRNFEAQLGVLAVCINNKDKGCAEQMIEKLSARNFNEPDFKKLEEAYRNL